MTTSLAEIDTDFTLDRGEVLPRIIGNPDDFLVVTGLGGTARDMATITDAGANLFALGGAMGAAAMLGLGLALAQPERQVLTVTGDGELLMNVGALATIAVLNPPNLSIVCVDNGHYGETGYQLSHTGRGVDLEQMARGAGLTRTCTVRREADVQQGADLVRDGSGTSFVLLRVSKTPSRPRKRDLDAAACRVRFRAALGSPSLG
jgi:thiamine pyrophosphate-dependent acetolactate synthase large subunit-like protein